MASYLAQWTTAKERFEIEAGKVVGKTKLAKHDETGIFWIRKSSGMEKVCKLLDDTANATAAKATLKAADTALKKFHDQRVDYENILDQSVKKDADYKQVTKQIGQLEKAMMDIADDFVEKVRQKLFREEKSNELIAGVRQLSQEFAIACKKMKTIRSAAEKQSAGTVRATEGLQQMFDGLEQASKDVRALAPGKKSNASQWKKYLSEIQTIQAGLEKGEAMAREMHECYEVVQNAYITVQYEYKRHKTKQHWKTVKMSAAAEKECDQIFETMTKVLRQADDDHLYAFSVETDVENFRAMAEEATARIAALEEEQERLANRKQNRGKTRL